MNRIAVLNHQTKNAQSKENAVFNRTVTARVSSALRLRRNLIKIYVLQKLRFAWVENAREVSACIMIWNLVFASPKILTTKTCTAIHVARIEMT